MKGLFLLFTLSLSLSGNSFAYEDSECIVTRAAFDIGSGTTKMKVAKVDQCEQKIIEMLLEKEAKVPYKEELKQSEDNLIEKHVLNRGVDALLSMKTEAQAFSPSLYIGVATSAFRTANNGELAKKIIEEKTGIKIKVIDQVTEAQIGFAAASDLVEAPLDKIVVWDIGGGSMQMSTLTESKELEIYNGKVASVSFKNHIIENVQFKSLTETQTPNPMSSADYNLARRDAFAIAALTTSRKLRDKILKEDSVIIGIGGVHFYSIASNVSTNSYYTKDQVNNKIAENLGKTDLEIGGEYAATDLSNLVLVKGFMDALQIESVHVGNINLATGLLLAPKFAE